MSQSNFTTYIPGSCSVNYWRRKGERAGGWGWEIMSNTRNEGPSEMHSRTASSSQPVLHKMEYIL